MLQRLARLIGDWTDTAPASDTASSPVNGRLQRVAQNITSLAAALATAIGAVADAAWTSGSGSMISLLKAIAGAAISTNPVQVFRSDTLTAISTATTTTLKSGAGTLTSVTVNSKGTVASTVSIFDNTAGSGTSLGVIDSLNLGGTFFYNGAFATGLTLVTTGTVAPNITVTYR